MNSLNNDCFVCQSECEMSLGLCTVILCEACKCEIDNIILFASFHDLLCCESHKVVFIILAKLLIDWDGFEKRIIVWV